jgi:hypothetical protein
MLRVVQAPLGLENFGPWTAQPVAVSFSTDAPPPMTFRFDLPANRLDAQAELDAAGAWATRAAHPAGWRADRSGMS